MFATIRYFLIIFFSLSIEFSHSQESDAPSLSFVKIPHNLSAQYKDPNSNYYFGGCQFTNSDNCSSLFLHVKAWDVNTKTKEILIEGYLFLVTNGNNQPDTIPIRNYEVFIGRPKGGLLYKTKELLNNWKLREANHSNGFIIKTSFSEEDKLYINAGTPFYLQEWSIGRLLEKK